MTIAKTITKDGITVYLMGNGIKPFTMTRDHKYFNDLLEAVNYGDEAEIENIIDMASAINKYIGGNVQVENGCLIYKGEVLEGALVDKILEFMNNDLDSEYLIKFLENLMENPSYRSRKELYRFLEVNNMPITEDGRFIAFKWVRNDYKDVHSGRFDNSIGKILSMPRANVDDDCNNTCSAGLHVCSGGYTKFGERLMLVAVNPRDVVSVPTDYNNSKMRVSEYEVLEEIPADKYSNDSLQQSNY